MKVLLTGGTGFVGKNIEKKLRLQYGHTVYSYGSGQWNLLYKEVCAKLLNTIKPDIIVHAAGTVGGIGANSDNPGKFIYENLSMGINIIHQAMLNKIPKFIMLGTVCSYPKYTPVPFDERELWNGYPEETNAPYGIAKKALGEMLMAYNKQYNMNSAYLLPANMYGPHDHFNLTTSHVIPALILKVHEAKQQNLKSINIWGDGTPTREFLFAEDLADAIQSCIIYNTKPEPINIGTGVETSISELIKKIAEYMDYHGEINFETSKPNGQPRRCLNVNRAKDILLFNATTSLDTGLKKTIEWFKLNNA